MGIVKFTKDDTKFLRQYSCLVMYDHVDITPDQPNITYVLRTKKFSEQDVLYWLPYIKSQLIVCMDKFPRLSKATKELVMFDKPDLKESHNKLSHSTRVILKETDRLRAYHHAQHVPIPYALSFIKSNVTDLAFFRRLATIGLELPDVYTHALFAFGLSPVPGRVSWPKKTKQEDGPPHPFRSDDRYWSEIIESSTSVANQVRIQAKEQLPKGVKKTIQEEARWV